MSFALISLVFLVYSVKSFGIRDGESGTNQSSFGEVASDSSLPFNWDEINYVYAFGDSYTFVQGTRGLANFSFIGDLQNFSFTREELINDEIILKNTSSDGANWIEFLTGCFSGRPSDCTPRQLWDFAFAGADIDGNLLPLHHPFTVPLVDQVKQWAKYAASFLPHPTNRTLTTWWIGINDTGDSTGNKTITDFHAFYVEEMDSLFAAVELAHSTGLNGAHLFLTVPPEERSPSGLTSSKATAHKSNIIDYNDQLRTRARTFAQNHPNTPILIFDAHKWFNYALDNAASFGFSNITGFCTCTDPGFFWYNSGHPTEYTHKLLATAVEKFLSAV